MKARELLKTMLKQTDKELLVTLLVVLAVVPCSIPIFLVIAPIASIYLIIIWITRYIRYKRQRRKTKL